MQTLNDTLNQAIGKDYYKDTRTPRIVKFMEYGSQSCIAAIFTEKGNLIDAQVPLKLDSKEERKRYQLIPNEELPESIKNIKRIAQGKF